MAEKEKPVGAGAEANPSVVAGGGSSPPASSGVGSSGTKEAFAECLAVATNKHQELAALHLSDAWSARYDKLQAQLEELLEAVEAHRDQTWDEMYWRKPPDRKEEPLLAELRDDDHKVYSVASKIRAERESNG